MMRRLSILALLLASPAVAAPNPPVPAASPSDAQCAYAQGFDMNAPVLRKALEAYVQSGTQPDLKDPALVAAIKKAGEVGETAKTQDWAGLCAYKADNAAQAAGPRPRVVFMGDSITYIWQFGDPSLFAPGVLDRGISGQTSSQVLLRFYDDVVALHPAAVHLMIGTNDIAQNTGPIGDQDILANIHAMIDLARANHIKVFLASILPMARVAWRPAITPAGRVAALNQQLRILAAQTHVTFVDYYPALEDASGGIRAGYSNDGVHPNLKGYAAMRPIAERALAGVLN